MSCMLSLQFLDKKTEEEEMILFNELLMGGVFILPGSTLGCQEPGWFRVIFTVEPLAFQKGGSTIWVLLLHINVKCSFTVFSQSGLDRIEGVLQRRQMHLSTKTSKGCPWCPLHHCFLCAFMYRRMDELEQIHRFKSTSQIYSLTWNTTLQNLLLCMEYS